MNVGIRARWLLGPFDFTGSVTERLLATPAAAVTAANHIQ